MVIRSAQENDSCFLRGMPKSCSANNNVANISIRLLVWLVMNILYVFLVMLNGHGTKR